MANKSKKEKNIRQADQQAKHQFNLVFGKQNYFLMIIGMVLIILGFILMYGGKEDIYSFRKITLAPILVVAGFIVEVVAIMRKPASE